MSLALIIGHTGQDGRLLWEHLRSRGDSIIGISSTGVDVHRCEDPAALERGYAGAASAVARCKPNHVYYLAAHHHSSQDSHIDADEIWNRCLDVHVNGFRAVLEAVTKHSPASRVFYASSSRVFGRAAPGRVDESSAFAPECIYGLTKLFGMRLADHYRRNHDVHVCAGILFNHESPLRGANFVTQRVINGLIAIKRGLAKNLELGDIDARVDWGYAGDYVKAMRLMLEVASPADYVVSSGVTHSVRDLLSIVARRLDMNWEPVVLQRSGILTRGAQQLCGDPARLISATGWRAEVGFEEMVNEMVDVALQRARNDSVPLGT